MGYKHLYIMERELLMIHLTQGMSLCQIAKLLGRNKHRKKCRPHKLFENPKLFVLVKKLFLDCHWSPKQISNRLKLENYPIQINYKTIYRAIYAAINVPRVIAKKIYKKSLSNSITVRENVWGIKLLQKYTFQRRYT